MDKKSVLEVKIQALDQEIANIHRAKILHEVKVLDYASPTGDAQVDKELKVVGDRAKQTLVSQRRMLEVREKMLAELEAERDAISKE